MTRSLPDVLATLGRPRLLVVGDLAVDRYVEGAVGRISPEAPIPVLHVTGEHQRLGCAGSVAHMVAELGAEVDVVGAVGDDPTGQHLVGMAKDAGLRVRAITSATRPTTIKTRFLASSHTTHQQVLRVDRETTAALGADDAAQAVALLDELMPSAEAVLVSDYGKGFLTDEVLGRMIAGAKARGVPCVVDPKGTDYAKYRGATGITPNRSETAAATGLPVRTIADAERAGARLVEDLDLAFALITLDRDGMYLRPRDGEGVHLTTTPREVFDVTGAGDMVLGVLATALASGATPREAASLANVAAGIEVERVGVATVSRDEIAARLAAGADGGVLKCVDRTEIGAIAERHRVAGRRVVFTNGCFDILHAGHVRYLNAAKAEGDVLILGLNSDASVRELKGEGRPVNAERDRAEVLSGLAAVDYVVVFEEDTPAALIDIVQPDVLVKGADWKDKGVVGRETVEARGGRVVLVDLLEGRSTTNTIERIRD